MTISQVPLSPQVTVPSPKARPLTADLTISFDYTRSLGPVLSPFALALRDARILGGRTSDGRTLVPPPEFDPATGVPTTELIGVADTGTVVSWAWQPDPKPGQPLDRPFAWALIRLDGADGSLLHAVAVDEPSQMSTGMRVHAEWREIRCGLITDIEYFVPGDRPESGRPYDIDNATNGVTVTTPVSVTIQHSATEEESWYLEGLKNGKLIGGRVATGEVYFPPRQVSPADGSRTVDRVELPDTGTITTFCIVNVPFLGQQITPPYVAAYVLLDGADIPFLHLILDCDPAEVRMGMRIRAVWRPRDEWDHTLRNISHFAPTGEPDAPFETYRNHL